MNCPWLHSKHLPEPKFWSYFALESLSQVKSVFHGLFLQNMYVYQIQFGEKNVPIQISEKSLVYFKEKLNVTLLNLSYLLLLNIFKFCDFMHVLEIVTIAEKRNNPPTRVVYFFCKVCNLLRFRRLSLDCFLLISS